MFFQKISKILSRFTQWLLGTLLIFSCAMFFLNIILRYFFNASIYWIDELVRYMMVWLVFIGAGTLISQKGHISISIIRDTLSPKTRKTFDKTTYCICLLFCGCLCYYSFEHTLRIKEVHQVSASMEIPMWLIYFSVPCGSALMTIRYFVELVCYKGDA